MILLADDAGAGKTIMAGLLIRELKLRGLADRILIVTPANLAFQWQRELREKFDEKFLVLRGPDLRVQFGVNPWRAGEAPSPMGVRNDTTQVYAQIRPLGLSSGLAVLARHLRLYGIPRHSGHLLMADSRLGPSNLRDWEDLCP